jgi:alkylated DNA repair protein (DNA oxidative demethylase)
MPNEDRFGKMDDLFGNIPSTEEVANLAEGAVLFRGCASETAPFLVGTIQDIAARSPFRHMITPGGYTMSVAMTNCGRVGWTTDSKGYRYAEVDPETNGPWPAMPVAFHRLAEMFAERAGFSGFDPDSCLINRYDPGAKLSLHQDKNEQSFGSPIVSVSLGLPAKFLFGGKQRNERPQRIRLESGDVVVWGGPSRLAYHGVDTLADSQHPLTGRHRFNLTFRKALD